MKIAFLVRALNSGGAQKMMAFVIGSVSSIADEIVLIFQDEEPIEYVLPDNTTIVYLNRVNSSKYKGLEKISINFRLVNEVRRILKKNKIDIICTFGSYFSTLALFATYGTKTKLLASERRYPLKLGKTWFRISKFTYSRCHKVVFQLEGARSLYPKIVDNNVAIIPNPYINTMTRKELNRDITNRDKTIVMAAARLEYEKGFDVGIKAMSIVNRKHPDYRMLIYGKGDFNSLLFPLVVSENLESVVEYKGLSKHIIDDIYSCAVFLLPSRVEGIPNMLMEAMGCGIPCVAADCPPGGPRMLFEDNKNGLLVDVDNYCETADAILTLIENESLSNAISINARSVCERFSPNSISQRWRECFLEIKI